jgi:diguanylate cyclase (GGDEF)-like protein/PAS domain S-box-containing protein
MTPSGVAVGFPAVARLAATAVAVAGMSWFVTDLARAAGSIPAIWPSGAIVLSILLTAPRREWAAYVLAGFLANAAVDRLSGEAVATAAFLALCDSVGIVIAATALRRSLGDRPDLARFPALGAFALWAGFCAPLVSATLVAAYLQVTRGMPFFGIWFNGYVADALGLLIFTPPLLLIGSHKPIEGVHPIRIASFILVLALAMVASLTLFSQHRYPLLFLIFPVLALAMLLHGYAGTVSSLLIVTLVAVGLAAHDTAAPSFPGLTSFAEHILFLQFFVAIAALTALPLAVLLDEKKRLESTARASASRYRLLADNALDLVMLADESLNIIYASAAAKAICGETPERLLGQSIVDMAAAEDLETVRMALRALYRPDDTATVSFRRPHADDEETVWIEARCRRIADPATGAVAGYLAALRDISVHKRVEAELAQANFRLEILATTDALTGIANRRCFDDTLAKEWRRAMRSGAPISLLLLDVDRFKAYNDCYGHQAGDRCLKRIAVAVGAAIRRQPDLAARYGGEEFAVILPHTELAGARYVAEHIVQMIREQAIQHIASPAGMVTASVGVACLVPQPGHEPTELVELADAALYCAKQSGRNTVRLALREAVPAAEKTAAALAETLAAPERAVQN